MSDLHALPLVGHDMPAGPQIRGKVFSPSPHHWFWYYSASDYDPMPELRHGPFGSWREAYDSAHRMVSLL